MGLLDWFRRRILCMPYEAQEEEWPDEEGWEEEEW